MTLRRRFFCPTMAAVPFAAVALLAGCGDDSSRGYGGERTVTPQQAIAEIGQVRAGLAAGLAAYRQGDAEMADELVSDAYVDHFELVEGPLGQRDEELNEELEELIREQLRDEIEAGAEASALGRLVRQAERELDEAEGVLGG